MENIVYIIRSGDFYKIGYSSNFNTRIKAYTTHNPTLEVVKTYIGNRSLEKDLHNALKPFRKKGTEWFESYIINIPNYIENYIQLMIKDE